MTTGNPTGLRNLSKVKGAKMGHTVLRQELCILNLVSTTSAQLKQSLCGAGLTPGRSRVLAGSPLPAASVRRWSSAQRRTEPGAALELNDSMGNL